MINNLIKLLFVLTTIVLFSGCANHRHHNQPMEYYIVRLIDVNDKGKILIINKECADILKIWGIDRTHVEDACGSWYYLKGPFYKKEVKYSDLDKLTSVDELPVK